MACNGLFAFTQSEGSIYVGLHELRGRVFAQMLAKSFDICPAGISIFLMIASQCLLARFGHQLRHQLVTELKRRTVSGGQVVCDLRKANLTHALLAFAGTLRPELVNRSWKGDFAEHQPGIVLLVQRDTRLIAAGL